MVPHVTLHMSEREALWPTSISVTCQDLWEMESKLNSSESVLMNPTPGPPCDLIHEHLSPSPPHNPASLPFQVLVSLILGSRLYPPGKSSAMSITETKWKFLFKDYWGRLTKSHRCTCIQEKVNAGALTF